LNKDVEIDDTAQLTFPDIQLKSADRVFRLYVKIIKGKTYCRGEKSLTLNQVLPEVLDNIRHPYKLLEKKLDHMIELLEGKSALGKQGLSHDN
jgi:fumarate hydratase class II